MAKIIGITGGIASGKSTVTNYLRQKGCQVIDADQVVHELQAKGGKLYQALVSWLGSAILNEAGELDRPKLSQLIFSSQENLAKSSQLQNEIIRQELANRRDQLAKTEETFFMDIPLLFEQDYADWFDEVWLVDVSKGTQLERLMARNNLSQEEAQRRIAAQLSLAEKRQRAEIVIDNNGLQIDGKTADVMPTEPLDQKLKAFGWHVLSVDGHDLAGLTAAFAQAKTLTGAPTMILAKTIKGKGVSFMENQAGWHGKAPNAEQYQQARQELAAALAEKEGK